MFVLVLCTIFDSDNEYIKNLLVNDILSGNMDSEVLKDFVVDKYYDRFLIDIKNKDDYEKCYKGKNTIHKCTSLF